jgi:hypothetical protein
MEGQKMSDSRKTVIAHKQSTLEKDTLTIAGRHLRQFPKTHALFKQAQNFIASVGYLSINANQAPHALFVNSLTYQAKLIPRVFNLPQTNAAEMTSFLSGKDFASFVRASFLINKSFSMNKRALKLLSGAIEQGFHLQDLLDNFKEQKESAVKIAAQQRVVRLINSLEVQGLNNFSTIYTRFLKLKKINPIHTLNEDQIILLSGNTAVIAEWLKTPRNSTLDLNGGQIIHYLALIGNVELLKQCQAGQMNLEMTDIYGNGIQHYAALSGNSAMLEFVKTLHLKNKKNYLGYTVKDLMKPALPHVKKNPHSVKLAIQTIEEKAELLFDTEINISGAQAFDEKYEAVHYAAHSGNPSLLFITELLGFNVQRSTIKNEKIDKLAKLSKDPVMMMLADVIVRYPRDDKGDDVAEKLWSNHIPLTQEGRIVSVCLDPKFSGTTEVGDIIRNYIKQHMNLLQLYLQLNYCLVDLIAGRKLKINDQVVGNLRFVISKVARAIRAPIQGIKLLTHDEKTIGPILHYEKIPSLYGEKVMNAVHKLPARFSNIQNLTFIIKYKERCQYLGSVFQYLERSQLLTENNLKKIFALIVDRKEGVLIAIIRMYHEAPHLFTQKSLDWLMRHAEHIAIVDEVIKKLALIKKLTQENLDEICDDIVKNKALLPSYFKLIEAGLFKYSNKRKLQACIKYSEALNAIFSLLPPDLLTQDNFDWVMSQVQSANKLKDVIARLQHGYLLTQENLHFIWNNQSADPHLYFCLVYLNDVDLLTPENKQYIFENVAKAREMFGILSALAKANLGLVTQENFDLITAHIQHINVIRDTIRRVVLNEKILVQDSYMKVFQPYVDKLNQSKSKLLLSWLRPDRENLLSPSSNIILDDIAEFEGLTKPAI